VGDEFCLGALWTYKRWLISALLQGDQQVQITSCLFLMVSLVCFSQLCWSVQCQSGVSSIVWPCLGFYVIALYYDAVMYCCMPYYAGTSEAQKRW